VSEKYGIYQVDDYDFWVATCYKDALQAACDLTGCSADEYNEEGHRFTNEMLEDFRFYPDPEDRSKWVSFKEQLENVVSGGLSGADIFASELD
jgi:hypothetical protein